MNNRFQLIQNYMQQQHLDSVLISNRSNRRYFSGFTGSTGVLLIVKEQFYFVTDFRYIEQATIQCSGWTVVDVAEHGTYLKFYQKVLAENEVKTLGIEGDYTVYNAFAQIVEALPNVICQAINLDHLRMIKSYDEVDLIKKAIAITESAFDYILQHGLKVGVSEKEVALLLERKMIDLGAERIAFDTIVASGVRGSLPHGAASDKLIEEGDYVTFDFGCFYQGYASDITRTVCVGSNTNLEMKRIYEIVLEAQKRAVAAIKPGVTLGSIDKVARDYIIAAGFGNQFGHSTGHGLGMEVHELPRVYQPNETLIEEGMLFTVEPGIYVPNLGGVRIEDDVYVTKNGVEILTSYNKELICLK